MNVQKQLTEIADYFKSKVLAGEFHFISATEHTAKVEIDGEIINLWICNNPEVDFELYDFLTFSKNRKELCKFASNEERLQGYGNIQKYLKEAIKASKLEQLERLQDELKNL